VQPKRLNPDTGPALSGHADDTAVMSHVLRSSEPVEAASTKKSDEEKMSIFWRVFGGAILSIIALVGITLFNNLMNHLAELRADLSRSNEARAAAVVELRTEIGRSNEARAELIRKDEFNTRMSSNWDRIQALQQQNNTQSATLTSLKTEIDGLKERLSKQGADVEAARKDGGTSVESLKKELTASTDSIRKEIAALEVIKERLVDLTAELKANRDEQQKLRQDVDRNQSYDLERKEYRDVQHRLVQEAIKELQKGLQDLREKLARLEGQTTPAIPKKEPAKDAPGSTGEAVRQ
jgi:chromosome segregation ATPase